MSSYLHRLATAVPSSAYRQERVCELMKAWLGADRRLGRLLDRVYRRSGVETRHSVIPDFAPDFVPGFAPNGHAPTFFDAAAGGYLRPTTGERNALYVREAPPLAAAAAGRVLATSDFAAADISHVITVSCTGFFAPGLDSLLVRELGLAPTVERYHLGFMGCYAAFPALRMADAFCRNDPDAVVLVVCLELCTLHLDPSAELDNIVATALFADGAAAALVSARPPAGEQPALELAGFATTLTDGGEGDMSWTISDSGFTMTLSSYVPAILEQNLEAALAPLFAQVEIAPEDISRWAVHPGGPAILDRLERTLEMPPAQLAASRAVLRGHGNMSSATVLFVLEQLLCNSAPGERLLGLAFGPGLTVESGLFVRV